MKASFLTSLLLFGSLLLVLCALNLNSLQRKGGVACSKLLQVGSWNTAANNDSTPHRSLLKYRLSSSQECRNYVLPFLNATDDNGHDQCTVFHNAYVAAHCPGAQNALAAVDNDDDDVNDDDVLLVKQATANVSQKCCNDMERFYLRYCQGQKDDYKKVSIMFLLIIILVLLCAFVKALIDYYPHYTQWIPDACAFILIGAVISGVFELLTNPSERFQGKKVHEYFYFSEDFFLQVLLPPTIFQAALSIDKPSFKRHLGPILLFALLGTALSAVAVGFLTHWFTHGYLPMLECLVFGALISSLDPVATLSILSGVGVDPSTTLYAIIAGESLLNDAVAIVLYDTLESHLGNESVLNDPTTYRTMAVHFVVVSLGSMAVAVVLGFLSVVFFWTLRGHQVAVIEVASFFAWAMVPYYVAELVGLSGIISNLTMGFIMDIYILGRGKGSAYRNPHDETIPVKFGEVMAGRAGLLSSKCSVHIEFVTDTIATTMETIIFAYLGLFLFDDKVYSMGLVQTAVWSFVVSRAFMVGLLGWLVNLAGSCRRQSTNRVGATNSVAILDRRTQFMLFLSGIRGAVSFALVSKLPVYDIMSERGTEYKSEMKAMTSASIIFTLFVFGALAYFIVERPAAANNSSNSNFDEADHQSAAERSKEGGGDDDQTKLFLPRNTDESTQEYGSMDNKNMAT